MVTHGKTVLIVDDDADVLDQEEMSLKRAGFSVIRAENRRQAEDWLAGRVPDIAIVDLMMETSDAGFTLCYHIKKKYPKTPVILLTSVTGETGLEFDSVSSEERGWIKADVILNKPIRFEQLKKEITRLLG